MAKPTMSPTVINTIARSAPTTANTQRMPITLHDNQTQSLACRYKGGAITLLLGLLLLGCNHSNDSFSFSDNASSLPQGVAATGTEQTSNGNTDTNTSTRRTLSVTLSWIPPSTRQDGNPLQMSEIWGYEILSVQNNNTVTTVTVPSADLTEYTFNNIPAADYSFSIYTYDVNSEVSLASSPVTLSVDQFPLL